MGKELEYYYKNKEFVNEKRRLKYKFVKKLINKEDYVKQITFLKIKYKNIQFDEDKINNLISNLEDCSNNELIIIRRYIEEELRK